MSNKNQKELSKLWKNAVDWSYHSDRPHTYNGIHADTYIALHYSETSCYSEAYGFASDIATSVPFVDPEDPNSGIDMDVFDQMHTLWEVAELPFSEFLSLLKLTPHQCATRFCIPWGTMEDWMDGTTDVPPHDRLMMAEAMGILDIRSRYAAD